MRVGITYDLKDEYLAEGYSQDDVAELDSMVTIDAIEKALRAQGLEVERIGNVRSLVSRLTAGERWDLVFNIAEGIRGFGREAQIPGILDAWNIPYTFSGPALLGLTLHKGWTNAVVRSAGVPTADFTVIRHLEDVEARDFEFPLFVKPVAEGSSKGISSRSVVYDVLELERMCSEIMDSFRQPALAETYLPGREFTIGLLGSGKNARVLGVMEVAASECGDSAAYTFENKQEWKNRVSYRLASDEKAWEAADVALKAWQVLGCLDAGRVDVRLDDQGEARFIEVNPLAGLNPESSDLPMLCGMIGLEYDMLIAQIVDSAMRRHRLSGEGI